MLATPALILQWLAILVYVRTGGALPARLGFSSGSCFGSRMNLAALTDKSCFGGRSDSLVRDSGGKATFWLGLYCAIGHFLDTRHHCSLRWYTDLLNMVLSRQLTPRPSGLSQFSNSLKTQ